MFGGGRFQPRREEDAAASATLYRAGAGVLRPTGSSPDGTFLKKGTGEPASARCSALAQRSAAASSSRAVVARPALADGSSVSANYGAMSRATPKSKPVRKRRPSQDAGRPSGRPVHAAGWH